MDFKFTCIYDGKNKKTYHEGKNYNIYDCHGNYTDSVIVEHFYLYNNQAFFYAKRKNNKLADKSGYPLTWLDRNIYKSISKYKSKQLSKVLSEQRNNSGEIFCDNFLDYLKNFPWRGERGPQAKAGRQSKFKKQ